MVTEIRTQLASALERGEIQTAIQLARQLLREDDGIRQWSHVRHAFERHPDLLGALPSMRIALLASFSIDFVHDPLIAAGYLEGQRLEVHQSGFNQFRQELLDPSSVLHSLQPDITILAVEGRILVPALYEQFLDTDAAEIDRIVDEAKTEIQTLVTRHAEMGNGILVMHDFLPPMHPGLGILDGQMSRGQIDRIEELNSWLRGCARANGNLFVVPYRELVCRTGRTSWEDRRMRHYAQAPIAQRHMPLLAREYIKYVRARSGRTRKCIVLDLDNTLWGGVLGEDGIEGIALGPQYPGSVFLEFQAVVKELASRGIILAVASKNNREDVLELFESHPSQLLKADDFAVMQIHWEPKSESLRQIASQLNIGLEHMVFVDDNPAECEEVMRAIPEITVIPLPKRPEEYIDAILADGFFDGLSYSGEDRKRAKLYKQRAQAESLRASSGSLESYYESLEMVVTISALDNETVPRAAQLTQKTNQFNLTTIRHDEATLRARMNDSAWVMATIGVQDRFGDNGIVGFVMAREEGKICRIETFLLSCRVIGRTIETAMLAWLSEHCRSIGSMELEGIVIPTKKNVPARDIFERHGFTRFEENERGESRWRLDPQLSEIQMPKWLTVRRITPRPQE